ncbi:hypothetical protein ACE7GA_22645 [Roseomonas sp. CCTCC AB2023176]|uniref:hypothetical protein n=1 Tax=Roseomonas sp. CCTCC AB2023176 TaxID=3342640 RepID=UPI0035E168E0
MTMADASQWIWAAAALAGTLLAMHLAGRLARRRLGLSVGGSARRVAVVEVTPIDPRRRAVLLRVDGREALVVTGGNADLLVGWL